MMGGLIEEVTSAAVASRLPTAVRPRGVTDMGAAQGATLHAIRQEADRLEGVSEGRFRSLRAARLVEASPRRLVLAAAAHGRDGDQDALRLLYLRYADNVYGYVCSLVHDEHEAEGVTQQLFANLRNRLGPLRASRSTILVVDPPCGAQRRDRSCTCAPAPCSARRSVVATRPDEEEVHPPGARDLREALDSLPEDQRLVIVMRFVLGLSPAEVAARIGRSEDAVHGLQHRGPPLAQGCSRAPRRGTCDADASDRHPRTKSRDYPSLQRGATPCQVADPRGPMSYPDDRAARTAARLSTP